MSKFEKIKYNPEKDWDPEVYAKKYASVINKFIFDNVNLAIWCHFSITRKKIIIDTETLKEMLSKFKKSSGHTTGCLYGEYQVNLNNENEVELKWDIELPDSQIWYSGFYEKYEAEEYAKVRCVFRLSINRYRMRIFWKK